MSEDAVEELEELHFKLGRKDSVPPNEYTMTEIEKISIRAKEIIESQSRDHAAIPAFKAVKKRSDDFHPVGLHRVPGNIEEVKTLTMQAFQELFDREPGIAF